MSYLEARITVSSDIFWKKCFCSSFYNLILAFRNNILSADVEEALMLGVDPCCQAQSNPSLS